MGNIKYNPEVMVKGILGMRLCVPDDWTDEQIIQFAEKENPAGTSNGWYIAEKGDTAFDGASARIKCEDRENYVHLVVTV